MALTPSTMMPLGASAPDFALPDAAGGGTVRLADLRAAHGALIMFICNHCPFVHHVRGELARLAGDYQTKGFAFAAICSNDAVTHPEDAPAKMKEEAEKHGYPFPYLHDETQEVARAYNAACTPDFFLFDAGLKCVYRGQLDDSRPGNGAPVDGRDIRAAMDAILAGAPVSEKQKPSMGCNIKWKA